MYPWYLSKKVANSHFIVISLCEKEYGDAMADPYLTFIDNRHMVAPGTVVRLSIDIFIHCQGTKPRPA
jgi:hypothetical protein